MLRTRNRIQEENITGNIEFFLEQLLSAQRTILDTLKRNVPSR